MIDFVAFSIFWGAYFRVVLATNESSSSPASQVDYPVTIPGEGSDSFSRQTTYLIGFAKHIMLMKTAAL